MSNEFIKRILSSIILIPLSFYSIISGGYFFNIFLIVCFLIILVEWFNMAKKIKYNIFGYIFIIVSFYTIYKLRNNFEGEYFYFLFVTLICIFTDIGGYVFGKLIKGPKLTKLSPNKTYAGMFGGYILPFLVIVIYLNMNLLNSQLINLNFKTVIFIILVSTVSQLGDIFISYFKRLSNIKDTGKIIPGHGGLLDRFDGMIFAYPFSYIILSKYFL